MLSLLCVPALVCAVQGNETVPLAAEIATLIERTNALDSLHLVYDLEITTEMGVEAATIDVVYRAPALARIRVASPRGSADNWTDETHLYSRSDVGTEDGLWHRAALPEPPRAARVFGELFPRAGPTPGFGTALDLKLTRSAETGEHGFELVAGRGTCLLGWLADLQRRLPEVTVDGEAFVLADEESRYQVARATGLLEKLEVATEQKQLLLRLRESRVSESLAPDLVTLPEEARAAVLDQALTTRLQTVYGPGMMRHGAFLGVQRRLDSGERAWDEDTRGRWRACLDALHRERIEIDYAERRREREEYAEKLAAWIRSERRKNDSFERMNELDQRVAEDRTRLAETLQRSEAKYIESLPPIASAEAAPRAELFDVEREVIAGLWNELLREPLFADFDQKLGAALGR